MVCNAKYTRCNAELEFGEHKRPSTMLACNFALRQTRKKLHLLVVSITSRFLYNFPSCGSQLPGHLKAQFICNSVIVSCSFCLMNGNLCTWKHQIIHPIRATSINASFAFKFLLRRRRRRFVVVAVKREEKFLSVSRFWWQQEICDDVHLIKQLNKAERFNVREDVSWDDLPIKPLSQTAELRWLAAQITCCRTQCKLITPIKPAIGNMHRLS